MLKIKIDTGNAAFTHDSAEYDNDPIKSDLKQLNNYQRNHEVANILRDVARQLEVMSEDKSILPLTDLNGNRVGILTINNR